MAEMIFLIFIETHYYYFENEFERYKEKENMNCGICEKDYHLINVFLLLYFRATKNLVSSCLILLSITIIFNFGFSKKKRIINHQS